MTLTLTTITRDEALAFILSGMQTKRAEIDATLRDLRSQQNGDDPLARIPNHKYQPMASEGQLQNADTQPLMESMLRRHIIPTKPRKRRKLSRAARKAISDAQKRRWAKAKA